MNEWQINQQIDLQKGYKQSVVWENALMVPSDKNAHKWRVAVTDGGMFVDLTGCTCRAYFVRSDGAAVLCNGTVHGNGAEVILNANCYAKAGTLRGIMQIIRGTEYILSALETFFCVREPIPDVIVDPDHIVPSLEELLAQIEVMQELIAEGQHGIRYDAEQTLTAVQKQTAQSNIGLTHRVENHRLIIE